MLAFSRARGEPSAVWSWRTAFRAAESCAASIAASAALTADSTADSVISVESDTVTQSSRREPALSARRPACGWSPPVEKTRSGTLCERRLVQADGGGRREVHRLGLAIDRDGDHPIHELEQL